MTVTALTLEEAQVTLMVNLKQYKTMAKLYKTNGEVVEITPANGKKFTLKEAQEYVNGYVELVELKHREMFICNEEGILLNMPFNKKATEVLHESYGPLAQKLYGDIIHCLKKEF